MEDKKIIAQYLYDLAKESKNEFVEISKDSELINIAKKMNIVVPSLDIAILKTIYAQTDVPNRNKIVLSKEAVKRGLPSLIGKNANWSHKGKNFVCGWILDAKLEKDLIIIYVALFKSLFVDEFDKVKELFEQGQLSVSFEIWRANERGESVLHDLENGIRSVDPIVFHGVGILIGENETPACPKAYAKDLLAVFNKNIIEEAEKIVDKVFEPELIYASMAIEEPKCKGCNPCTCEKEDRQIMADEIILTEKELKIKAEADEKARLDAEEKSKIEATEKARLDAEDAALAAQAIPAPVTEPAQVAEPVAPVVPAQVVEPVTLVKEVSEESVVTTYTPKADGTGNSQERKGHRKNTRTYSDGTSQVSEEDYEVVNTYTQAQLEEKVNASTEELVAAFPPEVGTCVKGKIKDGMKPAEAVKECWKEYKDKQAQAMADVVGEKDKEITKQKEELGTKDQELVALKAKKEVVEPPKKKIVIGSVSTTEDGLDEGTKVIKANIDRMAYGEKKSK